MQVINDESAKKEPTFEELKEKWMSTDFIESKLFLFRKKGEKENPKVARFREQIRKLEDREYHMIGYGSLMNTCDIYRTMPRFKKHQAGYINGWRRIFNMGNVLTGSYLNVYKAPEERNMLVAVITVDVKDMPSIIAREINYEFVEQTVFVKGKPRVGLMVVGLEASKEVLNPQLNYLHLCVSGAYNLEGDEGATNFVESTDTMICSLSDWFKHMNFLSLMTYQTYLSR